MNTYHLNGKEVTVFGCGDSIGFKDVFCTAVDMIIDKATTYGAIKKVDGLKVDGDADVNLEI